MAIHEGDLYLPMMYSRMADQEIKKSRKIPPMQLLENAREWLEKAKERGDPREIETAMRLVERNERLTTLKV